MRKRISSTTPSSTPLPELARDSTTTNSAELKMLTRLIRQLAACTATADALLETLLSKEIEAVSLADSHTSSTSSFSSTLNSNISEDRSDSVRPSGSTSSNTTQPRKVNLTGSLNNFSPRGLSADGFHQCTYNGFLFDVPPHDHEGTVYVVTRGRRVGIYSSWITASPYVNRCKGNAFVAVPSVGDAYALMREAIDNKTACWMKG